MRPELVYTSLLAGMQDNDSMYAFNPSFIRNANDYGLTDGGMAYQSVFNLRGEYIFSSGNDHILQPIHDIEVTLLVQIPWL